jgi:dihydroorotate dehydrogenase electron transfer subunit
MLGTGDPVISPCAPSLHLRRARLPRKERVGVLATELIGPYTLLRVERNGLDSGAPGQFFMLEAPGRLLPRPMSLCLAPPRELAFLIDPVGPGTKALCALEPGEPIAVFGPLGNGFDLRVDRPLLVGGGVGIAPFPYLAQVLGGPRAVLGFRSAAHAEAAELLPRAEVVVEPVLVTDCRLEGYEVLACGPEAMLDAVARLSPGAQLAREAPMACGYGACYGCAVEIDGRWRRLCVEGPVVVTAGGAGQLDVKPGDGAVDPAGAGYGPVKTPGGTATSTSPFPVTEGAR